MRASARLVLRRAWLLVAGYALAHAALPPASAASSDQFVAACAAGGGRSAASCACQAKLARSMLDPQEMRVALDNMNGNRADMRTALAAMGDARAEAFVVKLRRLAARAAAICK